jgi:hypothetical protein
MCNPPTTADEYMAESQRWGEPEEGVCQHCCVGVCPDHRDVPCAGTAATTVYRCTGKCQQLLCLDCALWHETEWVKC